MKIKYIGIRQSSKSGVGNNSVRRILNYSKFEYLNIPGKELKVNDITEEIFFQEKNKIGSH